MRVDRIVCVIAALLRVDPASVRSNPRQHRAIHLTLEQAELLAEMAVIHRLPPTNKPPVPKRRHDPDMTNYIYKG